MTSTAHKRTNLTSKNLTTRTSNQLICQPNCVATNSFQISSTLAVLTFMNNSPKDCLSQRCSWGGVRDEALRTSAWEAKPIRNGEIFESLITEFITYLLLFFCQKIPQLRKQVYPHLMCEVGVSVAQLSHWTQKRGSLKLRKKKPLAPSR